MATELVKMPPTDDRGDDLMMRTKGEVIARATRMKEIQDSLMKPNVHYGTIPGTQKPTLYQPGADLLCVTFRIAPTIGKVDDLSTDDERRYRVTVTGINQASGEVLGEGIGECSSDEERYRWRRALDEEWNETPADRRRIKWAKGSGGKAYQAKQVRTQIADVSNTVLKIAVKRAKVAMTINVTAASDVFAQDLEDLTAELREQVVDQEREKEPERAAPQPAGRVEKPQGDDAGREAATRMPVRGPSPIQPIEPLPVGRIRHIHDRGGGAVMVELETDFVCSTRDPKLFAELVLVGNYDPKPVVSLVTRPSADPQKYAPILVSFTTQETYGERG